MALAGRDTGGSQFFITLSPQPHLDGRYTVFGRVVNGFEVLDQISQWDVIERVRIWDGVTDALKRRRSRKKGGDNRPPFSLMGWAGLPLLAALFLCALGCFLCHCPLSPPSRAGVRGAVDCAAVSLPPGTQTCAGSALASVQTPHDRDVRPRASVRSRTTKKGAGLRRTLVGAVSVRARVAIATGSRDNARTTVARIVPVYRTFSAPTVPHRWAEPVVPTQDVDYGCEKTSVKHKVRLRVKTFQENALVLSSCFSPWRAIASAMRRSTSVG